MGVGVLESWVLPITPLLQHSSSGTCFEAAKENRNSHE